MMPWAASEQRNCAARAASSAEVRRPSGARFSAPARRVSPSGITSQAPVRIGPGDRILTRMPRGASSTARWRARDSRAALEAPTREYEGMTWRAPWDDRSHDGRGGEESREKELDQVEKRPDVQGRRSNRSVCRSKPRKTYGHRWRRRIPAGEGPHIGHDHIIQVRQALGAGQVGPAHGQGEGLLFGLVLERLGRPVIPDIVGDDTGPGAGELQGNRPPDALGSRRR